MYYRALLRYQYGLASNATTEHTLMTFSRYTYRTFIFFCVEHLFLTNERFRVDFIEGLS
jgi:hypothetical protein